MIELLIGLDITNQENYSLYRKNMTPLLQKAGGDFGYDFEISKTLKSKTSDKINRLFTINFPDESIMNSFFSSSEYLEIKNTYFKNAVKSTTFISKQTK